MPAREGQRRRVEAHEGPAVRDFLHRRGAQAPVILVECPHAGVRVAGKSRWQNFPATSCSNGGCGS